MLSPRAANSMAHGTGQPPSCNSVGCHCIRSVLHRARHIDAVASEEAAAIVYTAQSSSSGAGAAQRPTPPEYRPSLASSGDAQGLAPSPGQWWFLSRYLAGGAGRRNPSAASLRSVTAPLRVSLPGYAHVLAPSVVSPAVPSVSTTTPGKDTRPNEPHHHRRQPHP